MSYNNKWETYSEEMEDEDYVMEEEDEEEEEMRMNNNSNSKGSNSKAVYPEGFGRSQSATSPRFSYQAGFRYGMNSAPSPVHGWSEAIDEKGDSVALLMQLEKSIVHQKFFNNFADDFDEDDLA